MLSLPSSQYWATLDQWHSTIVPSTNSLSEYSHRVLLFHTYSTMLLDSFNGTILNATFHINMINHRCCCHTYNVLLLQSSITTNIVTFSQCILLCSLDINNQHHSLDMNSIPLFPPERTYSVTIVVVITIMHKLTPRVMLWLTCTNILW
jgi:hypothetical protein